MNIPAAPTDHVTPYDRFALDEATLVRMLAARKQQPAQPQKFSHEQPD